MEKITLETVSNLIPVRDEKSYKNKLGHVLCIGGNEQMGGAILLTAAAALSSGAGLVTVATDPSNQSSLHSRTPECMFLNMYDQNLLENAIVKADVIVVGPGLGTDEKSQTVIETVQTSIHKKQWLILDADALNILSRHSSNGKLQFNTNKVVLTPHLGEWERLTGIQAPAECVSENQKGAEQLNAIVVLKKHRTEIYNKSNVWQNTAGNPSMATGGMGDTLAGILASFLAQFEDKDAGIISAVYLHSAIADDLAQTHYVTLPSLIIQNLPIYMRKFMK